MQELELIYLKVKTPVILQSKYSFNFTQKRTWIENKEKNGENWIDLTGNLETMRLEFELSPGDQQTL